MKLIWSTLKVGNLERSIAFYQDILDLKVIRKFDVGPGGQIAFLDAGAAQIELIQEPDRSCASIGEDISWGFAVDSLDEFIEKVKRHGVGVEKGPFQPSPYTRFLFIKDPDGMNLQIVEQLSPAQD